MEKNSASPLTLVPRNGNGVDGREDTEDVTVRIPTHLVRPFANQPRKYFDPAGILALAESIKEVGQITPVPVKRINDDPEHQFELIDGERRLRACVSGGIPTIKAFVKTIASEDEQFIEAVVANFGSAEHTPLEITFAMQRMRDGFVREGMSGGDAADRVARIVGRSKGWVYQYIGLARLCTEVQELVNQRKLSFLIGVALSNHTVDSQRDAAMYIIQNNLSLRAALFYVGSRRTDDALAETARRRPAKDYAVLLTALRRLDADVSTVLDMKFADVERIFRSRTVADAEAVIELLRSGEQGLSELRETIEQLLIKKKDSISRAQA
jgi:ParB family chromosome partitioning protein